MTEGAKPEGARQSPLFETGRALLETLLGWTPHWPKNRRRSFTEPLELDARGILETLHRSTRFPERRLEFFREADVRLAMVEESLLMARNLNIVSIEKYETASRLTRSIGRMIGATLKGGPGRSSG